VEEWRGLEKGKSVRNTQITNLKQIVKGCRKKRGILENNSDINKNGKSPKYGGTINPEEKGAVEKNPSTEDPIFQGYPGN